MDESHPRDTSYAWEASLSVLGCLWPHELRISCYWAHPRFLGTFISQDKMGVQDALLGSTNKANNFFRCLTTYISARHNKIGCWTLGGKIEILWDEPLVGGINFVRLFLFL